MWDFVLSNFHDLQNWLLVGALILLGHAGGKLAGRGRLPSVVGYLAIGVLLGRSLGNVVDAKSAEAFHLVTDFGLGIVAFVIGSELSAAVLKRMGRTLVAVLCCEALGAVLVVFGLVWALGEVTAGTGFPVLPKDIPALPAALVFGALAAATAPAGTVAVIQECKAKGPMTRMLLAVVGLDDGLAIILYAFAAAAAKALLSHSDLSMGAAVGWPFLEILGSLALGGAVGAALAAAAARTRARGELLTLTLGAVLLTTGLSNVLHLSLILANLALGMAVVNISRREAERTATAVNQITHPVYVLFFVVAGAHLDLELLAKAGGLLMLLYIIGRSIGKMGGAWAGARLGGAEPNVRRYLGMGLLPQAGVAVGLALLVAREFANLGEAGKQLGSLVINTIAATTVFFEIVGPIAAKVALTKAGEINVKTEEEAGEEQ